MGTAYRMVVARTPDGGLELVSGDRVDMTLAGDGDMAELAALESVPGQFVETTRADGSLLQKRAIALPVQRRFEYPTGDADRPFGHAAAPPDALFSILVPLDPETRRINLVEQAAGVSILGAEETGAEPAIERRELLSLDIGEDDGQ